MFSIISTKNSYKKFIQKSYNFNKTSVLSIVCDKCSGNDEKIFKEIEILKILGLIKKRMNESFVDI